jgi:hypothetical protein
MDVTGAVRPFNARPGTFDYDLGAYEFQSSAVDVTPPNAICQNVTVNLNAGGNRDHDGCRCEQWQHRQLCHHEYGR